MLHVYIYIYIYMYLFCSLRRPARPRVSNGYVSVHTNFPSVVSGSTEATIRLAGMLLGRIRAPTEAIIRRGT